MKRYFFISAFLLLVSFSASADTLGQSQQFFISSQYDAQSRVTINATLRHVSDKVYFYVENDYWNGVSEIVHSQNISQITELAKEFDSRIYPIETQFFGSEPNPGVDNDSRITILLTPLIEKAGGYFDTTNQYPNNEVPNSNQREIIYLNILELSDQSKMFSFLAHEFQHLISFNQKENLRNISDDIWLNELRSEYATTLMGYNDIYEGSHLQRRARALLESPSDSLTEWKNLATDYGQIGLFGEYVAEHLSPQVIAGTLKSGSIGLNSFVESLSSNGFSEIYLAVFRDWLIANFLNDTSINPRFGYTKASLAGIHVAPTRVINNLGEDLTLVVSDSIKDWQGKWYDVLQLTAGNKNVLKITFNSPSLTSFYISYLVFGPDGKYSAYYFNPTPSSDTLYISGIGTNVSRIVIMPIKKDKFSGFSANEPSMSLTFSMDRVAVLPDNSKSLSLAPAPSLVSALTVQKPGMPINLPDGTLIRAKGDYKVYVTKGLWRRHISNSKIFNFYPGLGFEKVLEVDPSVLNQYIESSLIRYAGGKQVYDVDEAGRRRWLNISGDQFFASGRAWGSVFEVNLSELTFYPVGVSIAK